MQRKGVVVNNLCSAASGGVCCAPDLCTRALGDASKCVPNAMPCDGVVVSGYCGGDAKCCSPRDDTPPAGGFLRVEGDALVGWACDRDAGNGLIDSHLYIGAPAGSNATTPATSLLARCPYCLREEANADYLAGNDVSASGCTNTCQIG